jgi:hypothetical protein
VGSEAKKKCIVCLEKGAARTVTATGIIESSVKKKKREESDKRNSETSKLPFLPAAMHASLTKLLQAFTISLLRKSNPHDCSKTEKVMLILRI